VLSQRFPAWQSDGAAFMQMDFGVKEQLALAMIRSAKRMHATMLGNRAA